MMASSSAKSIEKISGFTPRSGEVMIHLDSFRKNKDDDSQPVNKNKELAVSNLHRKPSSDLLKNSVYSSQAEPSMVSSRVPINSFSRDESKTAIWMSDPPIYGSAKIPSAVPENLQAETKRLRDQIM